MIGAAMLRVGLLGFNGGSALVPLAVPVWPLSLRTSPQPPHAWFGSP